MPAVGASEDVQTVKAPPVKKRRVWPVGEEGTRVDALCVSAVTMSGAHLAEWGQGVKMYERVAAVFNKQPLTPFSVDGKAVKDRFLLLKCKFKKKEGKMVKSSGRDEEVSEVDAMLADACSAIKDSKERANKAKGEATKAEEALLLAGEDVRRSTLGRRAKRRDAGGANDKPVDTELTGKEDTGALTSPSTGRGRHCKKMEDDKDEVLVALVKNSKKENRRPARTRLTHISQTTSHTPSTRAVAMASPPTDPRSTAKTSSAPRLVAGSQKMLTSAPRICSTARSTTAPSPCRAWRPDPR